MLAAALIVAPGARPSGAAEVGQTSLVSHIPAAPTTTGNASSGAGGVTADGAFVVFTSSATDLVAGQSDDNASTDVFLLERATGAVTLVSHASESASTTANDASRAPSISTDGAYVVFESTANDLVAGQDDAGGTPDVFLFARATGAVTLVSHAPGSTTRVTFGFNRSPSMSADGAYVTFQSSAGDLVEGQIEANSGEDVFLFARATGAVTLVSHAPGSATTTANSSSVNPVISADGTTVAFGSFATNLVAGQSDGNGTVDVFLFTRATGTIILVSHTPAGAATTGNQSSSAASISADGAYVAFHSSATDLVAGDANGRADAFLFARATGALTLVSHAAGSATTPANDTSVNPVMSADGAYVAFSSDATNLVAGQTDANGSRRDAYLFARATGVVTLVSHASAGATTTGNDASGASSISADGAYVTFSSAATNLVAGQSDPNRPVANTNWDMFLFERATGAVTLVSHIPESTTTTANNSSFASLISVDGTTVVFMSDATNLVAGQSDSNGSTDVFLFARAADPPGAQPADFDGNGTTDKSIYRPSTGQWFVRGGSPELTQYGATSDLPVAADYDGNHTTDKAVYRPSTGQWFVRGGSPEVTQYGASGDIPVPGDYNGDGTTDKAIYRPSTSQWFVRGGSPEVTQYGASGDIPVPGDYDGDGTTDKAVYRPSTGQWFVRGGSPEVTQYGASGDIPVPGDYDGGASATTDKAVYRPSTGQWFVRGGSPEVTQYGASGDQPQPGDYDGGVSATTDKAVYRPSTGQWFVRGGSPEVTQYGATGDVPLPLPSAITRVFFP
ncbi:MAG: TolB family protein [Acidimicrobiales bacterium]